ncbi:MAG: hypothetical protein KDA59_01640, partial [Planctomycetales bacterium]|nr:hypothetical protein [Planctomycetales bacterium]
MWMKWLPWRYVVSRVAKSQGFLDPLTLMARLRQFAQPSEVAEPVELLRAGAVFHARGLINSRAIQHNLDWVWPYWAERQFDPLDDSFVPRAFSITHVNLTHRNWTAVGQPDCDWLPIVDPRGLVTPLFDGWSLDAWIVPTDAEPLLPSRRKEGDQWLRFDEHNLHVETRVADDHSMLESIVEMVWDDDQPVCQLRIHGQSRSPGWLVVSLRPTNPEGVAFIHRIDRDDERTTLTVDETATVHLDRPPERLMFSEYRRGDVYERVLSVAGHRQLPTQTAPRSVKCEVGLATAAAMYRLDDLPDYPTSGNNHTDVVVRVPLVNSARAEPTTQHHAFAHHRRATTWQTALADTCRIVTPDDRINELYEGAVRSLLLHSPDDCYPGPYTYKRFWFRDAAFLVHGLLTMGASERAARVIERFPLRQKASGYFHSQEGEWDSNGQVLWI